MFSLCATVWYWWVVFLPSSRCSSKCCQRSRSNGKTIKWRGRSEWWSWQKSSLVSNPSPGWRKMVSGKKGQLFAEGKRMCFMFLFDCHGLFCECFNLLKQIMTFLQLESLNPSKTCLSQRTCRRGSEKSQSRSSLWTTKTPLLLGGRLFNSYRLLLRWTSSRFTPALHFPI